MSKSQIRISKSQVKKFCLLVIIWHLVLGYWNLSAQEPELEFNLDINSETIPLPNIFKPNIDLSGRGFHSQSIWPQVVAAEEVLSVWQKEIGFRGMYRLQYNLWEINQVVRDKELQDTLLHNYEKIIQDISDSGGIVILDIFGTPAGLGKVLDKTSPPLDLKVFKRFIKAHIRRLSCEKKYNIWYEFWSAPDLDDFFLGRKQDYLNLYRAVSEVIKELEAEYKIHIPLGGPSVSWWFQNIEGNTAITPEKSLIYELIKFAYHYELPLDFISWHAYSSNPQTEYETTIYNKTPIALIRDWLSYFNFDKNTPLIIDEWNYDRAANVLPERRKKAFICASYIPSRIKNMYEAGLDYQLFFSLEDFQSNKEGVVRNTGIFWFDFVGSGYKGGPKSNYPVFRMLSHLAGQLFLAPFKVKDDFVGLISTKEEGRIALIIYNYIDPDIVRNYLSKNIATLNGAERKFLLALVNSDNLSKVIFGQLAISDLRLPNKVKALLKKARELNEKAVKFRSSPRTVNLAIKNLQGNYSYQRYVIDTSCGAECEFVAFEEKEIVIADAYQDKLTLEPYSVNMIILKQKPKEEIVPEVVEPPASIIPASTAPSAELDAPEEIKEE